MNLIQTKLITVVKAGTKLIPLLQCEDGTVIEHQHFDANQEGICAALLLAADVNAGKFWLKGVKTQGGQLNHFLDHLKETPNG